MLAETCEPPLLDSPRELWNSINRANRCRIRDIFVLFRAYDKVANFKHQIRRSETHPYFEFPYSNHLFTPQIELGLGRLAQDCPDPKALLQDFTNSKFTDFIQFYTAGSKSDG